MSFLTPLQLAKLHSDYQSPRHLQLLQRFVLEILATPGARGIVQLPVRHGKSEFISRFLPAWYLMSFPHKQVILSGYGNEFAEEWGEKARDVFDIQGSRLFGLRLNKRRAKNWSVAGHNGSMRTCGTLGPITGKGAHLLISDDQIKDQAKANSPSQRDAVWNWFKSDALTRLEPGGNAIVVLSRRHPDDLVGRLLENGGWRTLRMAAICDDPEQDPLGRGEGEALWSDRYPKGELLKIRDDLEHSGQSHFWHCLYQQSPTGDPGACEFPPDYFHNIWCQGMPETNVKLRVLALDPSKGKRQTTGDYSAFTYLVLTNDGHLWVQSWLSRIPLDKIEDEAVALLDRLRPDGFIYEASGFQELLGKPIMAKCMARNIPCPIFTFMPQSITDDKFIRIRLQLTPLLGQKRLHLDEQSLGNRLLLNQLREFPTGAHDDGPDSMTMGTFLINQLLTGKKQTHSVILRA